MAVVERFRREVGVPPKVVARLARFRTATIRLASASPASLGGFAAECGYADQSHFNRDFREFGGCTPTEYHAREAQP